MASVSITYGSNAHAQEFAHAFRRVKAKQLALVGAEQKTKREALDFLRRHFTKLRTYYLRIPATTYQDWIDWTGSTSAPRPNGKRSSRPRRTMRSGIGSSTVACASRRASVMAEPDEKRKLARCLGCRDDFYNDKNPLGVKRCWSLREAEFVTRWRIHAWTEPTRPGAFTEIETLSCYRQDGFSIRDTLPSFAIEPHRLVQGKEGRRG